MKNLKEYILTENNFFKNLGIGRKALIKDFCEKYTKFGYTINSDETIDATVVNLREYPETEIPEYIQFNKVMRMSVASSKLKTLRGCPKECTDFFDCSYCEDLETLKGGPQKCGDYRCKNCPKLTNLMGSPQECLEFDCSACENLESLKGGPKKFEKNIEAEFKCMGCTSLTSLKGGPNRSNEYLVYNCSGCASLTSIKGLPPKLKILNLTGCKKLKTYDSSPKLMSHVEIFGSGLTKQDVYDAYDNIEIHRVWAD
jgi:hypothetical protein